MKRSYGHLWFYFLCFLPFGYQTYSLNFLYSFNYITNKFRRIRDPFLKFFIPYVFISYLIGLFFFIPHDPYSVARQFISFMAFSSGLFLLFIKFDSQDIGDILKAAYLSSILYAGWVILMLIIHHNEFPLADIYGIKGRLREYVWDWPQIYVPLMIFSLIVSYSQRSLRWYYYPSMLLILSAVFFTFTRSAYLALFAGFITYFISSITSFKPKALLRSLINFLALLMFLFIAYQFEEVANGLDSIFSKTNEAFLNFIYRETANQGSDADRLAIIHAVFSTSLDHFLTGTGFGGIYLFTNVNASSHNQFLDTFLKLGVIGVLLMIYVFFKLCKFFYQENRGVFSGLISLLVYSLFNSIYQQPYLLFLIFSLLSFVDMNTNFHGRVFSHKGKRDRRSLLGNNTIHAS